MINQTISPFIILSVKSRLKRSLSHSRIDAALRKDDMPEVAVSNLSQAIVVLRTRCFSSAKSATAVHQLHCDGGSLIPPLSEVVKI